MHCSTPFRIRNNLMIELRFMDRGDVINESSVRRAKRQ